MITLIMKNINSYLFNIKYKLIQLLFSLPFNSYKIGYDNTI